MRKCVECKEEKELEEFHIAEEICKECENEMVNQYLGLET